MIHHQRAVAHADNLLRLIGQHSHRHARVRQPQDDVVYLFLRAHVHALGGIIQNQQFGMGAEPFCQHHLLLVAARQAADGVVRVLHLDFQALPLLIKRGQLGPAVDQPAARQLPPDHDGAVFQDIHVLDDAVFLAVAGQIADAQRQRLRGGMNHDWLAIHQDAPAIASHIAEHGAKQLASAIAQQARHAQHFARADAQRHIAVIGLKRQVFQAQHLRAQLSIARARLRAHLMAHHVARQVFHAGIAHQALGHNRAVAQHGVAIANLHDFAQLMRDKNNADLLLPEGTQHLKNALYLRIGQGGGGLIHDNDGGLHHQSA